MSRPDRPGNLNGEHSSMWDFMVHLSDRIDRQQYINYGILTTVIGILVKLLLD